VEYLGNGEIVYPEVTGDHRTHAGVAEAVKDKRADKRNGRPARVAEKREPQRAIIF